MTRKTFRLVTVLVCFTFGSLLAQAQNSLRSWVSALGSDAGNTNCSRMAPCRTLAHAILQTKPNGEILILDPGGYGTVTIDRSITIDATGTLASVLAANGQNGITINLNPADALKTVRLRGLMITGMGDGAKTGLRGISIVNTNFANLKVFLEDMVIDGFSQEGIRYELNGGNLVVKNSTIRNNDGAGLRVDSPSGLLVHVTVEKTSLVLNGEGIRFEDNVRGGVFDSTISNNTTNGVAVVNVSAPSIMQLDQSRISENGQAGVLTGGGVTFGTVTLSECMVIHNNVGLQSNANGQIRSFGQNRIAYNITSNGAFTPPIIPEQ